MLIVLLLTASLPAPHAQSQEGWTSLFNGKDLSGWDTYLGPDMDSSGKKISDQPTGLNNDPRHVFTVVKQNGENIIRISGESWGAISSLKEYQDYHLMLRFKWGNLTWGQKKNKKKDSGLLYHSTGDYGVDYGAWMRSQEFQIEETNCGDYWGVAGGMEDIKANRTSDSQYVYDPRGALTAFSVTAPAGRHCKKSGDAENPPGQWNLLDLYCHGDTSVHVINGKVMMVLVNSRQPENGREIPLTTGKLQIQSEGAEVFYKDIKIRPIHTIPASLLID